MKGVEHYKNYRINCFNYAPSEVGLGAYCDVRNSEVPGNGVYQTKWLWINTHVFFVWVLTSFIECSISKISAKVGLRAGSLCQHFWSRPTSIGWVLAGMVGLKSCKHKSWSCSWISYFIACDPSISHMFFLSFPWANEKIRINILSSYIPFEQQQQLLEEVSCLHKEAENQQQNKNSSVRLLTV